MMMCVMQDVTHGDVYLVNVILKQIYLKLYHVINNII